MDNSYYVSAYTFAKMQNLELNKVIEECEAGVYNGAVKDELGWFIPKTYLNIKTHAVKKPKNTASIAMLILTLLLFLFWMFPAVTVQFGNNDPVVTSCYEGIFGNEYISQNPTLITCFIFTILSVITILFSIYCRNYSFRKIWYACTTVFLIFNFPTVLSTFISQATTAANLSNSDVTITVGFGIIATVIIQFICLVISLYLVSSKEED